MRVSVELKRLPGGGAQSIRTAADLDLTGDLEGLPVEAQNGERFLDHVLGKKRLTIPAPDDALVPLPDLCLRHLGEFRPVHRVYDREPLLVVEGVVRRSVRTVLSNYRDEVSIIREGQSLDNLTDIDRAHDTRRLSLQIDDIDGVDVPRTAALISDHGYIALRTDIYRVRPNATGQQALRILDVRAVDRQHGDAVIAVAGHKGCLAIGRECHASGARGLGAEIDLTGGS